MTLAMTKYSDRIESTLCFLAGMTALTAVGMLLNTIASV